MDNHMCMPLGLWERFFETIGLSYELRSGGELLMAFGERVFFYERTTADIFCLIQAVPA